MAVHDVESLEQPFTEDVLLQVRTGRVKNVFGLPIQSAIFKNARKGAIRVSKLGADGDEQAYHDHGGQDKALMQYCTRHYDNWKEELPASEHLFTFGGFGENLVTRIANERNVCIGDVIAIGEEVIIQVTGPRQPCSRLNQRFEVKDMSRRSQALARTGWHNRVLHEGSIQAGDKMKLIHRPNPQWTVSRVQDYLYRDKFNVAAMNQVLQLEGLGKEVLGIMQRRLEKQEVEDFEGRLTGDDAITPKKWADYRIAQKHMETARIASLVLEAVEPVQDPITAKPGSHVRLKISSKLVRAYSVVGGDSNRIELGIALEDQSRGGSKYIHETARLGDVLAVGQIKSSFPLSNEADHHIIFAGGIGITAFIAAVKVLDQTGESYAMHYAVRSADEVPFKRYLDCFHNVKIYNKAAGQRMDIQSILSLARANSHVYTCGPQRMVDAVTAAAKSCDFDQENVHFETFQVAASGDPFTAKLSESKTTINVDSESSLLDALRKAGFDIDSSCEAGNCGTCRVTYCQGKVEHRGTALIEQEMEKEMLTCVSRGIGEIVLEL